MTDLIIDDTAIVKQKQVLEKALTTSPEAEKELRELINEVIKYARDEVTAAADRAIKDDPRGAALAVRRITYKKILGANLNLLNMRSVGKKTSYEPPRKLDANPKQWGGNRVKRGKRTQDVMTYGPHDRGFILRFINSGVDGREAGTRGGALHGKRGGYGGRNFFGQVGHQALDKAAERLSDLIDEVFFDTFDKID